MTEQELTQKLNAPFDAKDVEWRIQQTSQDKKRGLAVAFITSRAIQKRLDETVGPFRWRTEFTPWHQIGSGSQLCALSIYDESRKEWVTKTDGAENSDIEPIKGGLSDSFKRAAVQWGIGRYLYSLDAVWVDVEQRGKGFYLTENARKLLNSRYEQAIGQKTGAVSPMPKRADNPRPTAAPATLPPPKANPFTFDYTVQDRRVSPDGNLTAITLCDRNGQNIVCLRLGNDQQLAQGICLRNVRLNQQPGKNNEVINLLESYEIAA